MHEHVHTFDNQVRVLREQISPGQLERYRVHNVHELHEEVLFERLVRAAPRGGTFLSVGMAVGYYIFFARRLRPDLAVHAVEPLARHRAWFAENAKLNSLDVATVTVHPEAVAPEPGTAAFEDDGFASVALVGEQRRSVGFWVKRGIVLGLGAVGLKRHAEGQRRITHVPLVTLPTLLERVGTPVALMQMDVQGVEADVLEASVDALRGGRVTHALIGTHSASIHARSRAALVAAGFRIEVDEPDPGDQPDGMLLATHGSA